MNRIFIFAATEAERHVTCRLLGVNPSDMNVHLVRTERDLLGRRFRAGDRLVGNWQAGGRIARILVRDCLKVDDDGYAIADD